MAGIAITWTGSNAIQSIRHCVLSKLQRRKRMKWQYYSAAAAYNFRDDRLIFCHSFASKHRAVGGH